MLSRCGNLTNVTLRIGKIKLHVDQGNLKIRIRIRATVDIWNTSI